MAVINKVNQTRFGGSEVPVTEQGNCFQACVATLFGLPLEDAFDPVQYEPDWQKAFSLWLKPYGLGCVYVIGGDDGGDFGFFIQERKGTYSDTHVVVACMEDGYSTVIHDPNPNTIELGKVIAGFIFTPLCIEKFNQRNNWNAL